MTTASTASSSSSAPFTPVRIPLDPQLVEIRHYLHAHPERSFREFETSKYLAGQLRDHGITVLDLPKPLETGVIGLIEGTAGPGPRVGLRADIDGLPVHEETGLPYASVNEGVMHACGHDFHMAGLLGAAFWLAEHRDRFAGSVKIVFQPAEELGEGAHRCIEAGVADDVDAMAGTHNNPNYKPGEVAVGVEPMMAGCVKFRVSLHATGTHAGYPHKGTGPIEALASMILALQTIVSRNVSPFHAVVVSITEVHGGDVWNVVPAEAGFQGTVRFFDQADERIVASRFREQVEDTARAYGITADIVWDVNQRPLVGDPKLSETVADDVPAYAKLRPIRPSMAGEDFEEFSRHVPVVFAFIGSNGELGCPDWHSPNFIGLDGAIEPAVNFYANAALRLLRELA
ncbi:M20 metallopeptidase family protein [Bifidobacterium avesanii]|uniref:Amidohydrolase n=1 Tax=Bifidobacterium avesanii TaxID=1798157 RepID=A0A7K3TIM8_9BIFI|nr:amidohydrolase [Bifidobacterium avesanii]KAB8292856.1 N-acyl-L-amino acid amidohydrolase [Bifidobacterium avesanii]NEG78460.1 amidohydrolase [Bifidobacterium avesanii]